MKRKAAASAITSEQRLNAELKDNREVDSWNQYEEMKRRR
jgi:hypothetical protein